MTQLYPFTDPRVAEAAPPLKIVAGEGCTITDTQGRQYIDAVSGLWCTSLGFSGGGTLSCNPTSCQYDVSQCVDGGGCTPLFGGCGILDDNCCPGLTCVFGFGCLPE